VDQPRPAAVHRALVARHRGGITRAVHRGHHGHPTLFDGSLLPELAAVTEAREGMKTLLRAHPESIDDVEVDDPIVLVNLNARADYDQAYRLHGR
jgi:CTP:molybdopterin cytidylyltransferase MocA